MREKLAFIMLAALLSFATCTRLCMVSGVGSVIRVPADYPTIQEAINAAPSESVILVNSGVYQENLVINKTLSLIGEDKMTTVIDGGGEGTVIEIRADGVTLEGFTIQNSAILTGAGGVFLTNAGQCTIHDNIIVHNVPTGISLWNSNDNIISENFVAFSGINLPGYIAGDNIALGESDNNSVVRNILSDAVVSGLEIGNSNGTLVQSNIIENNSFSGLALWHSNSSTVHHNIFINNPIHLEVSNDSYNNLWNNGSEGNYWDDYVGLDDGNDGRIAGDGIGDTDLPHGGFNELGRFLGVDNYPFVRPPKPIPIIWESNIYPVSLEGNSTISMFRFVQTEKKIAFNVSGPAATAGYCNITIPKSLLRDSPWRIVLNGTDITAESFIAENETHSSIYFTYNHSISNVQIMGTWVVPEFSPQAMLTTMLIFAASMILLKARRWKKITSAQAFNDIQHKGQ